MQLQSNLVNSFFLNLEKFLLKQNGIKIITLPYGSDAYIYIRNKSLQNALLINYPELAKYEKEIEQRVSWWSKYSDIVVTELMSLDGFPRWDICTPQFVVIDTNTWVAKRKITQKLTE